jgi:superfamily II DNA helicase RecQ
VINCRGDKFRPTFVRLGELRSHFTDVPLLLLTATCTHPILQFVKDKLHMENLLVESISPDRY